jgi:hypothetical protein
MTIAGYCKSLTSLYIEHDASQQSTSYSVASPPPAARLGGAAQEHSCGTQQEDLHDGFGHAGLSCIARGCQSLQVRISSALSTSMHVPYWGGANDYAVNQLVIIREKSSHVLPNQCIQVLSLAGQSSCCVAPAAPGTDGLAAIVTSCTSLSTLNLEGCSWVSREAVQAIAQAQQQHQSSSSSGSVSQQGGEKAEGSCGALTRLHLNCRSLDDTLAQELAAACSGLVHITLEGSSLLTAGGVAGFMQVCCESAMRAHVNCVMLYGDSPAC